MGLHWELFYWSHTVRKCRVALGKLCENTRGSLCGSVGPVTHRLPGWTHRKPPAASQGPAHGCGDLQGGSKSARPTPPAEGQASNRGKEARPEVSQMVTTGQRGTPPSWRASHQQGEAARPAERLFVTGERGEQTDWRASQHQRKAGKARGAVRGHNGPTQIMIQTHLIRFPVHRRYKQPNARTSNALRSSLCS